MWWASAAGGVAGDLAVDPGAACLGVGEGLEHEHARALAHDETVPPRENGRQAVAGSSLRVLMAFIEQKLA